MIFIMKNILQKDNGFNILKLFETDSSDVSNVFFGKVFHVNMSL